MSLYDVIIRRVYTWKQLTCYQSCCTTCCSSFSSTRALCERARPGKYYLPPYLFLPQSCAAVFRFEGYRCRCNYRDMRHFNFASGMARPLVLQMSIGSGNHLTSGGPLVCLHIQRYIKKCWTSTRNFWLATLSDHVISVADQHVARG